MSSEMTHQRKVRLGFILILFFPSIARAQGGPPMVTDDPGTPGDRRWEINLAGLLATASAQSVLQIPYLDLNYGWGERIQLKAETGWVTTVGGISNNGAGTLLLGVKYRFLDEDQSGISISTYPQFQFHHFFSSHDPQIATPGNQYVLPVELLKNFGNWAVNPEVGYLYGSQVASEIFYGVEVAFEKVKPWEPLAEIHFNTNLDGSGSLSLLNLGFRYSLNQNMNLLFAGGGSIGTPAGELAELDTYLGLQLELP